MNNTFSDRRLLSPTDLGRYTLPNRIVMSPMTRQRADIETGKATALMADYYAQRAEAGLIVTECVAISDAAVGYMGGPSLASDAHIPGWQGVTDAVHRAGGKIFLQIWHAGRISHSSLRNGELPMAPSAIAAPGQTRGKDGRVDLETPREITAGEIAQTVEDFAQAAERAIKAGADGVELHGGFGYLVDTFLQASSNTRTDNYGGAIANRARFAIEVVEAVVGKVGGDRFGIRLGPSTKENGMHDPDPAGLYSYILKELNRLKVAYVHMLEPSGDDLATGKVIIEQTGRFFRSQIDAKLIANVDFDQDKAERYITDGAADLVAFGKAFISNPDLVTRLRNHWPLANPDFGKLFSPGPEGYTDYPVYKASAEA